MKFEILAYSHCGCCHYKFWVEAENEEEAEKIFKMVNYPSNSIDSIYEYDDEPDFWNMEKAIKHGDWEGKK